MAKKVVTKKRAVAPSPKPLVRKRPHDEIEIMTAHDLQALDEAVSFVNGRLDKSAAGLIEIGEYLLKHFFAGDMDKVRGRAPRKGISLRKLAEHPDILMSFPQLSRAVSLAVQETQLFSVSTLKHLTASHKLLLVGIDSHADLAEKELIALKKKYIERIEKDGLSVRALHELLMKDGYSKPRGLAAVEDAGQRKLLRSGYQSFVSPFEKILALDFDPLFDMPPASIKTAYAAILEARKRMDTLIKEFEVRFLR